MWLRSLSDTDVGSYVVMIGPGTYGLHGILCVVDRVELKARKRVWCGWSGSRLVCQFPTETPFVLLERSRFELAEEDEDEGAPWWVVWRREESPDPPARSGYL